MPLIVLAEARIDPAQLDTVRAIARPMIEASRAEPGCLAYDFAIDLIDPGVLRVCERWRNAEALKDHFTTPHMAAFAKALHGLSAKTIELKCYELGSEQRMPGR